MAIFGIGKKNNETEVKETKKVSEKKAVSTKTKAKLPAKTEGNTSHIAHSVLISPHITEKAGILSQERNVYTFDVSLKADKTMVKKAVAEIYKVTPTKVAIASVKPARKSLRGRTGLSSKGKKAYVYLKEGDKIEFI